MSGTHARMPKAVNYMPTLDTLPAIRAVHAHDQDQPGPHAPRGLEAHATSSGHATPMVPALLHSIPAQHMMLSLYTIPASCPCQGAERQHAIHLISTQTTVQALHSLPGN
mmetsp:Transcript_38370/g.85428  ORF Transcript_38370/g.85428 Transcript_38370/m.85428 type:complete len:110 (+) Transcript_38370:188-517(+)